MICPSLSIPLPVPSLLPSDLRACAAMNADRVCYVDSSAIVKLVVRENESAALRRYLRGRALVSSALAGVEVTRAIMPQGAAALRAAKEVLSCIDLVRINARVLSRAATMNPPELRTLDAIHLATASLFGNSVHRFVCYDGRLASAANGGNWIVVSPD